MTEQRQQVIDMDRLAQKVVEEVKAAEAEVALAREKLAAAKGRLDLLAEMQQEAQQEAQRNGVGQAPDLPPLTKTH